MTKSSSRRSGAGDSPPKPLTSAQTREWLETYGRHSRIYAWGFFVLVLPVILGVIWWEMGEINEDVLYSFSFAAVVTFLLARWSRRVTTRSWTGVVEDLFVKKVRVRRDEGQHDDIAYRPMARVRLPGGKTVKLRLTQNLYAYFREGDRVFKVSGLDWPEKAVLEGQERVCLACGSLFSLGAGRCPRCRAPEPDHETLARLAG
jgi:hypothetical protein